MANQAQDPTASALKSVEDELAALTNPKKTTRTMVAEAQNAADHIEFVGKSALEEATLFYEFCHRLAAELRRHTEGYARRTVSPKFFNGGGETS